ncbi:MAG: sigma-E factor negative regulatory protein [Janthinobacterium lividum]
MVSVSMQSQSEALSRCELLSAVADGECGEEADHLLSKLTPEDQEQWSMLHLIGDSLRSTELLNGFDRATPAATRLSHASCSISASTGASFTDRFAARLADEPHILAPAASRRLSELRRRAVPTLAVAAAAAALTWVILPMQGRLAGVSGIDVASMQGSGSGRSYAMQPAALVAARAPSAGDMARDADLDQYLRAHQQFAPDPVVQGAMPYIRASASSDE